MLEQRTELTIAKEFSFTPGPRLRAEGEFSGQAFLEELLRPRFENAMKSGAKLVVNLDGVAGYPSSFLEQAFGGLAREFGSETVLSHLELVCTDEPYITDQITKYIRRATTTTR